MEGTMRRYTIIRDDDVVGVQDGRGSEDAVRKFVLRMEREARPAQRGTYQAAILDGRAYSVRPVMMVASS